jgi:FixJ family two-component response regulator
MEDDSMKNKDVLIVDDEKNIRLTLSMALEPLGLNIVTAVNGEDALSVLKTRDIDIILLDLKMPGIDGIEVLRRVRELHSDIRVIIITAHGTIDSAVEAMKLGAVDFIQKPFAPQEIRDIVSRVIARDDLEEKEDLDYESLVELTKRRISERQFDAAINLLKSAVSLEPSRPEGFNLLGAIYEIKGDRLEALKHYRAANSLDATYEPAIKNLYRLAEWEPRGDIELDIEKEETDLKGEGGGEE